LSAVLTTCQPAVFVCLRSVLAVCECHCWVLRCAVLSSREQ
jgi:hypothetical protein